MKKATIPALLVATGLALTACGSSDQTADTADIATLEDNEVASLTEAADAQELDDPDGPETDPEQAALAFSQCMRDEGIDFPDVGVDAEGNVNLREAFANLERGDELRAARQACQSELAAGGFGGRQRLTEAQQTEIDDGLVAYSDCIRGEGFDVGDITLQRGGQQNQQTGNADENQVQNQEQNGDGERRGQPGERERGFGNRQARIVEQLGLDAEDPEVQAALTKCEPILEETFANFGPGRS